ncbi:MAG: nucleotide exchange factor GrpE [Anaerolineae bacterium]
MSNKKRMEPPAASPPEPDGPEPAAPEEVLEGEAAAETPDLAAQLEAAQQQAREYLDGWQRARAELDNYRKRMERERALREIEVREETVLKLLPVMDDFDRALLTVPDVLDGAEWVKGVQLIHRKLLSVLEEMGVAEIEADGQMFDPARHEAVMQGESDAHETGQIIEVLRKGYLLHDKVIRPALVRVAM